MEKLIDECETAEYPELNIDLCKARDVLESLGGGRGGQDDDKNYFTLFCMNIQYVTCLFFDRYVLNFGSDKCSLTK